MSLKQQLKLELVTRGRIKTIKTTGILRPDRIHKILLGTLKDFMSLKQQLKLELVTRGRIKTIKTTGILDQIEYIKDFWVL